MMTMVMVLVAVSVSLAAKVIFEDKFASLDPSWGVPGPIADVKDGKLIITPEINTAKIILNQGDIFPNDMEISAAMTFIKAPAPNWASGLVFWAKDSNEFYVVLVSVRGWIGVERNIAGRYLMPVAWRESDAFKKGEGAENHIKVATKGNKATIFLNGKEVFSFNGRPPQGGTLVGFKVNSGPDRD